MTLPENLKELRKKEQRTQADLAQQIGITQSAYANYENGTRCPDMETLIKIANIYNVSLDFLTGRYK